MANLSECILDLITRNPLLQTGMSHGLLNLTQTAHFLKPQIEARLRKKITTSSIVMNLSRLTKKTEFAERNLHVKIQNMTVNTDLVILGFAKSAEVHQYINTFYSKLENTQEYITITEGVREVSLIFPRHFLTVAEEIFGRDPFLKRTEIAALSVSFNEEYITMPGLFYALYQQLYFQNISIIEQASTPTELILYLHQDEVQLAFETLYNNFVRNNKQE